MSLRAALFYAVLLSVAGALALATRTAEVARPEQASARSQAGSGLAALETWLRECGHDVRLHDGPLSELPEEVRTLVIAAPSMRQVDAAEVAALRAFVVRGGRLVYLRGRHPQPALDGWLELADGAQLPLSPSPDDPGGTTARVTSPHGLFVGLGAFRVSARRGISSSDAQFLPVAQVGAIPVLLWRTEGRGEVLAGANPDLAENRRVELGDAPLLWARLAAQGPLAFDEHHHRSPAPAPRSLAPWVFGLQAVLCAVLLALTRGTPLGRPRTGEPAPLPSAMAYAASFGRLLRAARVEGELLAALESRLRKTLADRAGVPVQAAPEEVTRHLEVRRPELAAGWAAWAAARAACPPRAGPGVFHALSRCAAEVEVRARGLSGRG